MALPVVSEPVGRVQPGLRKSPAGLGLHIYHTQGLFMSSCHFAILSSGWPAGWLALLHDQDTQYFGRTCIFSSLTLLR